MIAFNVFCCLGPVASSCSHQLVTKKFSYTTFNQLWPPRMKQLVSVQLNWLQSVSRFAINRHPINKRRLQRPKYSVSLCSWAQLGCSISLMHVAANLIPKTDNSLTLIAILLLSWQVDLTWSLQSPTTVSPNVTVALDFHVIPLLNTLKQMHTWHRGACLWFCSVQNSFSWWIISFYKVFQRSMHFLLWKLHVGVMWHLNLPPLFRIGLWSQALPLISFTLIVLLTLQCSAWGTAIFRANEQGCCFHPRVIWTQRTKSEFAEIEVIFKFCFICFWFLIFSWLLSVLMWHFADLHYPSVLFLNHLSRLRS